ncbi:hypothetical protein LWI28_014967 [Acer negundo]|uniref:Uncharacterized protein n=1 Tax=Acer negundo TaxID=4023 RepID=A0AAD5I705_ACENE|nr:hypothetical protein LWI28_014967 [Acer negundo]
MKSQLEIAYMRKLRQLSNKSSSTATVQAKGTKRKSQVSKGTCGRKSTKSTSKASPSSKETTDISIDIVPREVDNPLLLPQIPHAVLSNALKLLDSEVVDGLGYFSTLKAEASGFRGRSYCTITIHKQSIRRVIAKQAEPAHNHLERPDTNTITIHNNSFPRLASSSSSTLWFR